MTRRPPTFCATTIPGLLGVFAVQTIRRRLLSEDSVNVMHADARLAQFVAEAERCQPSSEAADEGRVGEEAGGAFYEGGESTVGVGEGAYACSSPGKLRVPGRASRAWAEEALARQRANSRDSCEGGAPHWQLPPPAPAPCDEERPSHLSLRFEAEDDL